MFKRISKDAVNYKVAVAIVRQNLSEHSRWIGGAQISMFTHRDQIMTVINTQIQAAATSSNSKSNPANQVAADDTSKTVAAKPSSMQGDTVKISGHAMLLSRLFNTKNISADIPVVQAHTVNSGFSFYTFLTRDDRKMLESAYEHASANGMDPRYVDDLAFDLAGYRECPECRSGPPMYDLGGHKLTFDFSENDAKVANRILSSDALKQTSFDRGFIGAILNASSPYHAVNFEFLEKMISVFSASSTSSPEGNNSAPASSARSFATYVPPKHDFVTHVSEQVELVIPEPDYISINGVGRWRTPELAAVAARGASGHGRTGIDLTPYLTASNKETLTQALLSLLDSRTGETAARIRYIASMLDLPLTERGGEKSVTDSNKNAMLGVINNLNNFLDNTGTQDAFDAENFLKYVFNQKINTAA